MTLLKKALVRPPAETLFDEELCFKAFASFGPAPKDPTPGSKIQARAWAVKGIGLPHEHRVTGPAKRA